jgi:hypothetical protein
MTSKTGEEKRRQGKHDRATELRDIFAPAVAISASLQLGSSHKSRLEELYTVVSLFSK